jgi:hypothetical protein
MKYIFRGNIIFEYKPDTKYDKVVQGKIPIELSHKDGNFMNNKIDNLELICPNCHSLTDSYKGTNKKEGRPRSKYYRGL